jgi:hypothetical protein
MMPRALLLVLTAFWVTMNVLLWRAEYGGRPGLGSTVPAHVVWEKMLTAPDSSSLTIFHRGKKIGFCHWITSVGEDLAKLSAGEASPEGMVRRIVNYRLELDGNVLLDGAADRLRFDSHLSLGGDRKWQEFELRLNLRPSSWEVRSAAAEQTVRLSWQEDDQIFKRVFKFSEFQNPEGLLREFGGPVAAGILGGFGFASAQDATAQGAFGLQWEARPGGKLQSTLGVWTNIENLTIDGDHQAIYIYFTADCLFSSEDRLWPDVTSVTVNCVVPAVLL